MTTAYNLFQMQLCRGPLPDGHPCEDVIYFCVDQDIAAQACNLAFTPAICTFESTCKRAVLLDAHRAPDEWFSKAAGMRNLIVQGDPDTFRPRACNLFANALSNQIPFIIPKVHLRIRQTLTAAQQDQQGRSVILAGTRDTRDSIYAYLRPDGLQVGDGVMDLFGRYAVIDSLTQQHIHVDSGRRVVRRCVVNQHVVVSPSNLRSCEYDTVIVMPDVPEHIAKMVCRRVRYQIIAVSHSPYGYVS